LHAHKEESTLNRHTDNATTGIKSDYIGKASGAKLKREQIPQKTFRYDGRTRKISPPHFYPKSNTPTAHTM
jgi:hypothetical protein